MVQSLGFVMDCARLRCGPVMTLCIECLSILSYQLSVVGVQLQSISVRSSYRNGTGGGRKGQKTDKSKVRVQASGRQYALRSCQDVQPETLLAEKVGAQV